MELLSKSSAYIIFFLYGIFMIAISYFFARWKKYKTIQGFLVAERNVKWWLGATSIAASWIWAPALAVTVQLFAGGSLLYLITGIPLITGMIIMALIVLIYSFISGLESSIVTDFVQFILIIVGVIIVVPSAIYAAGGWSAVSHGFGGISGQFRNMFDPSVALSFGIVTSIGLIAGAISDQQYWQRAFAIKKKNLIPSFLFGAIMFGIVPIALSALGFLAANNSLGISLPANTDVSMIGVITVTQLLPEIAIVLFIIMLLSALMSTLDSGLNATSSLFVTDVLKYSNKEKEVWAKVDNGQPLTKEEENIRKHLDKKGVFYSKAAMFGITILGFLVALAATYIPGFGLKHLWWIFNTIAACVVVPTVLSLYWNRLDARGVFWGVLIAFVVGVPFFVYGNIIDNPVWIVGASLFIILVSTLFCLAMPRKDLQTNSTI